VRPYGSKKNHQCRVPGHDKLGHKHGTWCDPARESWHGDVVSGKRARKKRARRGAKKEIQEES